MDEKLALYKQWNVIQLQEERNPLLFDSIDETGGYYAKWNKPDKDEYFMLLLICWNFKKLNSEPETRMVVTRGAEWMGGNKVLAKWYKLSVKEEQVLRM